MFSNSNPQKGSDQPGTALSYAMVNGFVLTSLIILVLFLSLHAISLHAPLIAGDEYTYFFQSEFFPKNSSIKLFDPTIQLTNNEVYFYIMKKIRTLSENASTGSKIVQVLMFSVSAYIFFRIAVKFLNPNYSIMLFLCFISSPLSSYTIYYMPETFYFLVYCTIALTLVYTSSTKHLAQVLSGLLVSVLVLIKPHGIAVFISLSVFWAFPWNFNTTISGQIQNSSLSLIKFVLSFYLGLITLNRFFTGDVVFNPFLFAGEFYTSLLSTGTSDKALTLAKMQVPAFSNLAFGGMFLTILFAIVVKSVYTKLFRSHEATITNYGGSIALLQLSAFTLLSAFAMLTMTVSFTAHIGGDELLRIHGRYYSFFVPFAVLTLVAHLQSDKDVISKWSFRTATVLTAICALTFIFFIRARYVVNPWDFPEIFMFSKSLTGSWSDWWSISLMICFTISLIVGCFLRLFTSWAFIFFLLLSGVGSSIAVADWQYQTANAWKGMEQGSLALRSILNETITNYGLIIGSNRNNVGYFLFNFDRKVSVRIQPENTKVNQQDLPSDVYWIVEEGSFDNEMPDFSQHMIYCAPKELELMSLKILIRNDSDKGAKLIKEFASKRCDKH